MSRNTITVFVLATGIVAGALAGVSHHRAAIIGRAILQSLGTTMPPASGAADSSKAEPATTTSATAAATTAAQAIVVPVGTTLTVCLGEQLGSRSSRVGQSFSGTLDHDVVVDGQTAIAAGASVNGEVAFARPGGALVAEPNLLLKLTSVNVETRIWRSSLPSEVSAPASEAKRRWADS
ncbi:MAG: hypothetical protein WCA20_04810 [Candidatus Sulfotelmatobacter sp.]